MPLKKLFIIHPSIAYIYIRDLPDEMFKDFINLADLQDDYHLLYYKDTLELMSKQDFWWEEGGAQEPNEPPDSRRNWHKVIGSIIDQTGSVDYVMIEL